MPCVYSPIKKEKLVLPKVNNFAFYVHVPSVSNKQKYSHHLECWLFCFIFWISGDKLTLKINTNRALLCLCVLYVYARAWTDEESCAVFANIQ